MVTVGAFGAAVSTVALAVPVPEVLPTASVSTAVSDKDEPLAGAVRLKLALPADNSAWVMVWLMLWPVLLLSASTSPTLTLLSSATETATWPLFASALLITPAWSVIVTTGVFGAAVSTVALAVPVTDTLPTASVREAETTSVPPFAGAAILKLIS